MNGKLHASIEIHSPSLWNRYGNK